MKIKASESIDRKVITNYVVLSTEIREDLALVAL